VWVQRLLGPGHPDLLYDLVVGAPQRFGRIQQVREEVPDDLLIHGVAHADVGFLAVFRDEGVLGTGGGSADQAPGVRVLDQVVQEEQAGLAEDGERPVPEECGVARELPVVEEVPGGPRAAERPHPPHGLADGHREPPRVGSVVSDPPPGAVQLPGRLPASLPDPVHQVEEGLVALRQVRDLRRPVVHLDVDVRVVIDVPGAGDVLVPDPLQVGRQRARPG